MPYEEDDGFIPDPIQPGAEDNDGFIPDPGQKPFNPRHPFRLMDKVKAALPALAGPAGMLPEGFSQPVGSILGGAAGIPGGAVGIGVGTGLGAAAGRGVDLFKRKLRGGDVTGADVLSVPLQGAGEGLAAATGVKALGFAGKMASKLPGVRKAAQLFKGAAKANNPAYNERVVHGVRNAFLKSKSLAGKEFDEAIKGLKGTVDLSDEVNYLGMLTKENPTVRMRLLREINKTPNAKYLTNLLDNPHEAVKLTAADAQHLKNAIGATVKQKFGKVAAQFDLADLDLNDALHTVKSGMIKGLPGLEDVYANYGKVLGDFRTVKGSLGRGLEKNLISNFGGTGAGSETIEAVKRLLPEAMQKRVANFRTAHKLLGAGKAGAVGAAATGVGGAAWGAGSSMVRKLFDQR